MLRGALRARARRRDDRRPRPPPASTRGSRPRRSGSTTGPRWRERGRRPRDHATRGAVRRPGRSSRSRCGCSARRDDGFHELEALARVARPAARRGRGVRSAGARRRARRGLRVEVGEDVPSDDDNLAVVAAEQLLARAGRSGPRRAARRSASGSRPGAGSVAARPTPPRSLLAVLRLLDLDVDDAGVLAVGRRARLRRPVLRRRRPGLDAGAGRGSSTRSRCRRGLPFVIAIPPFRAVDARRCTGRGTSWAGRGRPRDRGRRLRLVAASAPSWSTTSSPRPSGSSRGSPSSATRSRRRPGPRRCWPGAGRPTWCRRRRRRLPTRDAGAAGAVVGDERRPRRTPSPAPSDRRDVPARRHPEVMADVDAGAPACASGPAGDAASASSSAASCASSSACACGAS